MADEVPQAIIEGEVADVIATEKSLVDLEQELAQNEQFRNFLERQKEAKTQIDAAWGRIKEQMIEHDIKTIKGDWGYITIAERTNYAVDEKLLPAKFFKKVADSKKIAAAVDLEGKLPKGVTTSTTKYLTKKIK